MSEDAVTERERDQVADHVLAARLFDESDDILVNRQAAADWGGEINFELYTVELPAFTPVASGALAVGLWPAVGGHLVKLNGKGVLPETADLEYGITLVDTGFHGIMKKGEKGFWAIVSGNAAYANKVAEPASSAEDVSPNDAQGG